MVQLSAEANTSDMSFKFDTDLFEEIPMNQSKQVKLLVSNYRLGADYQVKVTANVSDPEFTDSVLITLNGLEKSSDGDAAKVKVTFARDLLNENPECQELDELLNKADERLKAGDPASASQLVDSVINGCKYLVGTEQHIQENPTKISPIINIDALSLKYLMGGALAFVVVLSIALLIFYHFTHKSEDDI
jgi:hypothetical protein